MSDHGLQGRLDQQERRVTGIVPRWADQLVVIVVSVVTPGLRVAPGLVLVVQVEVRNVPELAAITDQNIEAQLENISNIKFHNMALGISLLTRNTAKEFI